MEQLTKDTFRQKVFDYEKNNEWKFEGELPCIIDFYADWCGPCKMVAPVLAELAEEYKGKVNIYKVDTDKEQELKSFCLLDPHVTFLLRMVGRWDALRHVIVLARHFEDLVAESPVPVPERVSESPSSPSAREWNPS